MKYVDFSDKPITAKRRMLWRLWDALGELNRARDSIKAAQETAFEAGIPISFYTILEAKIAELGRIVGECIENWERTEE